MNNPINKPARTTQLALPKGSGIREAKFLPMTDASRHVVAKPGFLKTLHRKLERPMLLLSFVWFLIIITELVNGMSPLLQSLGTVLWALFVCYFGLRLAIVPNRVIFLKRNWLFLLAILVPMLRLVPHLQSYPLARAVTATFGMQVIWMFASADQGLRSLRRTMGRRGTGYALTFTVVVILAGAAGMLHFENNSPDPQGIHSYPKALWWVAMQITNIGSGYQPVTLGGHVLCLGISIFAVAIFGYLTAVFAAMFIGRDMEDPKSEISNQKSILQLSGEIAQLRKVIEDVLKRVPDAASRPAEPPQLTKEPGKIKPGKVSETTKPHRA
jgi:voltage-gated potassium channel